MARLSRALSLKSGRVDGKASADEGLLRSIRLEFLKVRAFAESECSEEEMAEVGFSIVWADSWLTAYSAGWCSFHDVLDGVNRGGSKLPPMIRRLLLGVVAHKALFIVPIKLGEHRASTMPHMVRLVGALVQFHLFDDNDKQLCTLKKAVEKTEQFIEERDLIKKAPSRAEIEQWFAEWRVQETKAGRPVVKPKAGRPKK